MSDHNPSPASSSTMSPAVGRRHLRHANEEDGGGDGAAACTGKSCQSCTAGVIADCVAVCCCPCAVVNILVLAFFKLPWAVARKCLRGRRKKSRRRRMLAEERDRDGISVKGGTVDGTSAIVEEEMNVIVNVSADEVWLELYEVGHLGFGRVSFTGI